MGSILTVFKKNVNEANIFLFVTIDNFRRNCYTEFVHILHHVSWGKVICYE